MGQPFCFLQLFEPIEPCLFITFVGKQNTLWIERPFLRRAERPGVESRVGQRPIDLEHAVAFRIAREMVALGNTRLVAMRITLIFLLLQRGGLHDEGVSLPPGGGVSVACWDTIALWQD